MPLPTEFVTWRAYGSIRDRSPSAVRIVKRYSSPGADARDVGGPRARRPSPSRLERVPVARPVVERAGDEDGVGVGAQTRNVVPPRWGMAPIPAAFDGAVMVMPPTIAAPPIWWGVAETLPR